MATCVGPPDSIAMGSPTVMIGSMPAARVGDMTTHAACVGPIPGPSGSVIGPGCPTVMIGATPNTGWLGDCIDLDEGGYIRTGPGAARDGWPVADRPWRAVPRWWEPSRLPRAWATTLSS